MKILCVFPVFRSNGSLSYYSGAERQLIETCKRWSKLGCDIHVIGTGYSINLCRKLGLLAEYQKYKPLALKIFGFEDFVNAKRLNEAVHDGEYDFIYCPNEPFEYVLSSVLLKNRFKSPLVASVNLFHPNDVKLMASLRMALEYTTYRGLLVYFKSLPERLIFVFKKKLRTVLLRKADLIFAISRFVKKLLIDVGIDGHRVYSTSSGIDYKSIIAVNAPENKLFDACFLGAIIPRKGVFDLVKAWASVVKAKPEAKLAIIGHGTGYYMEAIRKFILDKKMQNNITITGFVPEEEKYRLLKQSKLFVFPSYLEAFPQTICEAAACKLPIIAYRLPVYPEFYGENIVYVEPGDIESLALKIIELLEDEDMQKRIGDTLFKIAENYDWDKVAEEQLRIIKKQLPL